MVILAGLSMATFRPARQRYDSSGKRNAWNGAYFRVAGRKVAMRKHDKSHHLAGFRVAPFRIFAPITRLYDMAQISNHRVARCVSRSHREHDSVGAML